MIHPPLKLGTCSYRRHVRPHVKTEQCIEWREQHALSESTGTESTGTEVGTAYSGPHDPGEHIAHLERKIAILTREAGMWRDKYDHLNNIYCKLADQWNAFQATARPDNRNVRRAEAAGELARKLAEVFLALAYDKDARQLITDLLSELHFAQQPATGQEVEVGGKLAKTRG